ncbi:MAG: hypothetical protein J6A67_08560 [Clostridia bacterium]|nr:hypothetical protein [Clostridia bacterium]
MEIPISLIHDFPDHPYKVKDDENIQLLVLNAHVRCENDVFALQTLRVCDADFK